MLSKYIQNNEKFHEKILKKSEKLTQGIHVFDEKLSIFFSSNFLLQFFEL